MTSTFIDIDAQGISELGSKIIGQVRDFHEEFRGITQYCQDILSRDWQGSAAEVFEENFAKWQRSTSALIETIADAGHMIVHQSQAVANLDAEINMHYGQQGKLS